MRRIGIYITGLILSTAMFTFAGDWVITKLDTEGNKGAYCSITFDNVNRPLVAYREAHAGNLLYARFDGIKWNYEKIDTYGDTGHFIDIAADGAGHPHISYVRFISFPEPEESELRYAYHDGARWHVEVVDNAGVNTVRGTSVAVDSNNHPHISYTDRSTVDEGRLKYAHHDGTRWHISAIEPFGTAGFCSAIAVDSANRPHISYVDVNREDPALKYAYFNGSSWKITKVEHGIEPLRETSIAVDTNRRPHISYLRDLADDLMYATFDGTTWRVTAVDHEARVDYLTSIALDRNNHPHISYTDGLAQRTCSLKYAYYDGSKWYKEYVEKGGDLGTYNAIAVDKKGKPHIVYYDGPENWDLKYAYRKCGIGVSVGEFKAFPDGEAVALRWTVNEPVAGFNLYRDVKTSRVDAEPVKINPELITGKSPYLYLDRDVARGATYRYWLEVVELGGPAERHGPAECTLASYTCTLGLSQNVPNPARTTTKIWFVIPAVCDVTISIYDVTGRKVKTVTARTVPAGENELEVDVATLAPGVYTYRLEAGGAAAARRMVIVR
jgi:hypothetical protein